MTSRINGSGYSPLREDTNGCSVDEMKISVKEYYATKMLSQNRRCKLIWCSILVVVLSALLVTFLVAVVHYEGTVCLEEQKTQPYHL